MYIGIDIGGTNTRIVTSKSLSEVVFEDIVKFPTEKVFSVALQKITETIKDFAVVVEGIGIGTTGCVSEDGSLYDAMNLPDWNYKPLKKSLEKEFNCTVCVKNDADTAALGEVYFGLMSQKDFLYVTWGTGIGCTAVNWVDNKPVTAKLENEKPVYSLQEKIGGNDIEKRFGKPAADLNEEEWGRVVADLINDLPTIAKDNGFALVLVGGGIAVHQKDRLAAAATMLTDIELRISILEGNAGLYGAISLLRNF